MKFSIIVPSLNQGPFIDDCLKSLIGQNFDELEVIVMDGGSTDRTLSILQRYQSRITFRSGKDGGQADAINRGLRIATGDIFAYLNSDDFYYDQTLQRVAQHFLENPGTAVVYGNGDHVDRRGRTSKPYPTEPWDYARLDNTCFICQPTVFWKREVTEEFGYFDDSLHCAMDYEFWLRIGQHVDFVYLKGEPLAASRMYPQNKTMSRRCEAYREILQIMLRYRRDIWDWLLALAHVEIEENPKNRLRPDTGAFRIAQMDRTLSLADEFKIPLTRKQLRAIEEILKGVLP